MNLFLAQGWPSSTEALPVHRMKSLIREVFILVRGVSGSKRSLGRPNQNRCSYFLTFSIETSPAITEAYETLLMKPLLLCSSDCIIISHGELSIWANTTANKPRIQRRRNAQAVASRDSGFPLSRIKETHFSFFFVFVFTQGSMWHGLTNALTDGQRQIRCSFSGLSASQSH